MAKKKASKKSTPGHSKPTESPKQRSFSLIRKMTEAEDEAIEKYRHAPDGKQLIIKRGKLTSRRRGKFDLFETAPPGPQSATDMLAFCRHWLACLAEIDEESELWADVAERTVAEAWAAAHKMKWADMLPERKPMAMTEARELLGMMRDRAWKQCRDEWPALSPTAALVYEILLDLKPYEALTTPKLLLEISRRDPLKIVEESTLRGRIKDELEPFGIQNFPRIGYRIRPDMRPPS